MTPRQAPEASRTSSGVQPAVALAAERTPELLRVAKRMVWFKEPKETLRDPVLLLCHVMTYGTVADIATTRDHFSDDHLREALRLAHPGIFDARSWAYWHVVLDVQPVPPLPTRRLPT